MAEFGMDVGIGLDELRRQQLVSDIAGAPAAPTALTAGPETPTDFPALPSAPGEPIRSPAPWEPGGPALPMPGPTRMEKTSELIKNLAPLAAQLGAGFSKGTPFEGVSQAIAGTAQAWGVGRERQKILDLLKGGQGGGQVGFPAGPERPAYSGVTTLGLTPEQTTGLYGIAETQRVGEREWPLKVMGAVGELYNRVAFADYHYASIPYLQEHARSLAAQTDNLPDKYRMEMKEKLAEIGLKLDQATKAREETKAIPAETALKEARAGKARWEIGGAPSETAQKLQVARAMPWDVHVTEQGITTHNKVTNETHTIPITGAGFKSKDTALAWNMANGNFLQRVQEDIAAKYGSDTQKAKAEWGNLMYILKNPELSATYRNETIMLHLSPANRELFTKVMSLYRTGEELRIPLEDTQKYVNTLLSVKPEAASGARPGLRGRDQPAAAAPVPAAPELAVGHGATPAVPPATVFTKGPGVYSWGGKTWRWDGTTSTQVGAPTPGGMAKPTSSAAQTPKKSVFESYRERLKSVEKGGKTFKERMEGK